MGDTSPPKHPHPPHPGRKQVRQLARLRPLTQVNPSLVFLFNTVKQRAADQLIRRYFLSRQLIPVINWRSRGPTFTNDL
ncbi:uncharacterized protein V6R79_023195 [Siganus canaliculatus]